MKNVGPISGFVVGDRVELLRDVHDMAWGSKSIPSGTKGRLLCLYRTQAAMMCESTGCTHVIHEMWGMWTDQPVAEHISIKRLIGITHLDIRKID